ncbi:hybrid sensor histidine kinase/response regulator [Pseudomonas oryzihabitans]|uniref:hybrid sensor histidine kinase/response regulator n=1 Tax=Pseudomonas oryzihabitans TaxID=47885 RepID=UPI00135D6A61|nr:ATP-binding protein [Pseudomonas oryzihabitans]MXS19724.1 PAS domain-containing protein [Pseudomonas oryzihabitans]
MSLHTPSSDQPASGDLRQYERQTLESLATGLPLTQVLHTLLQRVEVLAQVRLHACILLLSEDGRYLQDGIAPSLPDAYSRDLGRLEIGPLAGSCGTAAYRREAVYVEDIAGDPLWAGARDLALRYGLRACWSMPLLALDGRLLGTFANYFLEPRRPLAAERDAFRLVTETAALAIERHQADLQLRESEDHYRHLVELNPQYTWTCDPSGQHMVFSPRWQQLTGQPMLEADSFWTVVHPDDRQATRQAWDVACSAGQAYDREHRVRVADGSHCWLRTRAYPRRDAAGAVIRWYGTSEDIDDRREAEEALRRERATLEVQVQARTAELEETNRQLREEMQNRAQAEELLRQAQKMEAVGQLTGGIAHDFNNLLAGIQASLDLLRRRLAPEVLAGVGNLLDTATQSVGRGASLTHRLLAFSRRQTLNPQAVDVSRLIGDFQELLLHSLGPQIRCQLELDAGLWPVDADPHQLENALLNLAINSRDAMPAGGTLTIGARNWVQPDANPALPAGDYLLIEVGDDGVGMAPEVLERVFEPFFTTKPVGQGSGLGLSMIYGFVRQSRGQVSVTSAPGQGCRVSLLLPRHPAPPIRVPLALSSATTGRALPSVRVLLVEDDAVIRTLLVQLFVELGWRYRDAVDAEAALAALREGEGFDLLITDVGLPGLNGRLLANAARTLRPQLPILFITGYAAGNAPPVPLVGERMAVLGKPFTLEVLVDRVQELLGKPETLEG